jgi:hypothetical protein
VPDIKAITNMDAKLKAIFAKVAAPAAAPAAPKPASSTAQVSWGPPSPPTPNANPFGAAQTLGANKNPFGGVAPTPAQPPQPLRQTPTTPLTMTPSPTLTLGQPAATQPPPQPALPPANQTVVSSSNGAIAGSMAPTTPPPAPAAPPAPGTGATDDPNLKSIAEFTRQQTNPDYKPVEPLGVQSGANKPSGAVIDMTKPLDENQLKQHFGPDSKLNPEQQTQLAADLATKLKNENPQYYEGFHDVQAGKTDTPAAKAYQQRLGQAQDEFVKQQVQSDPQKASTPQGFGEMVNNAISQFQNMPLPMQAMVGIGLPVGLIGIMSSMFGGGGMGMGLLGALGLGAGLMGGAAGGMFGQSGQNMAADAMSGIGKFLGMVPESLSDEQKKILLAKDPVAAAANRGGGWATPTRATAAKEVAQGRAQLDQIKRLNSMGGMTPRMLENMGLSPEDAQLAAKNVGTLSGAYDDPNSAINKKLQQGESYAQPGWGNALLEYSFGNSWNPMNWGRNKEGSMKIQRLVSGWAHPGQREVMTTMKAARCWAGYEPVPGKKPYSNDSCRPVGSKKKKTDKKKSNK